jgi:NADH:ubiquinone oxidoreductase subunit 6 (subunit J)
MFFFGSILLLFLDLEFFALIFLIVYVGAIAVLFLFMVMTLDIKHSNVTENFKDFLSYKGIIVLLLLLNVFLFLEEDFFFVFYHFDEVCNHLNEYTDFSKTIKFDNHLEVLGKALFKEYTVSFLLCGFILLIAMIGAIVISVEEYKYKSVKQQDPVNQAYRSSENSIFYFKIYKKNIKKLY